MNAETLWNSTSLMLPKGGILGMNKPRRRCRTRRVASPGSAAPPRAVRNAVRPNNASTPAMGSEIERHYDEAKRQADQAAQEAYHKDWEAQHLAAGICPWTGEPLTDHGDGCPGNLSCVLCDCFGYKPEEVRK